MEYTQMLTEPQLIAGLGTLLKDEDPLVIKRTIRVFANVYRHSLNMLATGELDEPTFSSAWSTVSSIADELIEMLEHSENEGITVHIVRFLEAAVLSHILADISRYPQVLSKTSPTISKIVVGLLNLLDTDYVGGSAFIVGTRAMITVACYKEDIRKGVVDLIEKKITKPAATLFDHHIRSLNKMLQRNLFRLLRREQSQKEKERLIEMMVKVGVKRRLLAGWAPPVQSQRKRCAPPTQMTTDDIIGRTTPPHKKSRGGDTTPPRSPEYIPTASSQKPEYIPTASQPSSQTAPEYIPTKIQKSPILQLNSRPKSLRSPPKSPRSPPKSPRSPPNSPRSPPNSPRSPPNSPRSPPHSRPNSPRSPPNSRPNSPRSPPNSPSSPPISRPNSPRSLPCSRPSSPPSSLPCSRPSSPPSSLPCSRPSSPPSSLPCSRPSSPPSSLSCTRPSPPPSSLQSSRPSSPQSSLQSSRPNPPRSPPQPNSPPSFPRSPLASHTGRSTPDRLVNDPKTNIKVDSQPNPPRSPLSSNSGRSTPDKTVNISHTDESIKLNFDLLQKIINSTAVKRQESNIEVIAKALERPQTVEFVLEYLDQLQDIPDEDHLMNQLREVGSDENAKKETLAALLVKILPINVINNLRAQNESNESITESTLQFVSTSSPSSISTLSPAVHVRPTPSPNIHVRPSPAVHVRPSPAVHVRPSPSIHVRPSPSIHVRPSPSIHKTQSPAVHVRPPPPVHLRSSPAVHVTPVTSSTPLFSSQDVDLRSFLNPKGGDVDMRMFDPRNIQQQLNPNDQRMSRPIMNQASSRDPRSKTSEPPPMAVSQNHSRDPRSTKNRDPRRPAESRDPRVAMNGMNVQEMNRSPNFINERNLQDMDRRSPHFMQDMGRSPNFMQNVQDMDRRSPNFLQNERNYHSVLDPRIRNERIPLVNSTVHNYNHGVPLGNVNTNAVPRFNGMNMNIDNMQNNVNYMDRKHSINGPVNQDLMKNNNVLNNNQNGWGQSPPQTGLNRAAMRMSAS